MIDISNFRDLLALGAIKGITEAPMIHPDGDLLIASSPMSASQLNFKGSATNPPLEQGPDSQAHSSPKFCGTGSPRQMESARYEESKNQGGVRLNNPDGEVLQR